MVNGELKFHDVEVNDAAVTAVGTIQTSIVLIAQGVTESERIGRKCVVRNISWRFGLEKNTATAATSRTTTRIIMYWDKQANGDNAAVIDILESDNYQSFNNLSNSGRFRILMDRVYTMSPTAQSGDGTTTDQGGFGMNDTFFKDVNIPLEFSAAAGAIASLKSNNIGILTISEADHGLVLDSKCRVRFTDS